MSKKIVPVWNPERAVYTVGETETHLIEICPMIYNHRVVLTPKESLAFYDVGWCYLSLESAIEALEKWNIETESEPVGYLKKVGQSP